MDRYDQKFESLNKHEEVDRRPDPRDFEMFLPWACGQLQVELVVLISKVVQNEYVSVVQERKTRGKSKTTNSRMEVDVDIDKEDKSIVFTKLYTNERNLKIIAIYDNCDNLVQLKFDKNINIPRNIIKILTLIIKFHIYLTSIVINAGLDKYSIYEICKMLPLSRITDICLDGTFLTEANYYMLFEPENKLRQISLARCRLDDNVISKIAEILPSSNTLAVLNLASNRITDKGAKCLGNALKTNRALIYLNLADNMITDDGTSAILDILMEFPMTYEEIMKSRKRHMIYLNKKKEIVSKIVTDLRSGDDKRGLRKKTVKPISVSTKKGVKGLEKEPSLKIVVDTNKNSISEAVLMERAEILAVNTIGIYNDAFSNNQTTSKDGVMFCHGNNVLSYLNLAYNNLTIFSLKKILNVLLYQKLLDRKPRGLINLSVEGNYLPVCCKELAQIDDLLDAGLAVTRDRRMSMSKKSRPASRSGKMF